MEAQRNDQNGVFVHKVKVSVYSYNLILLTSRRSRLTKMSTQRANFHPVKLLRNSMTWNKIATTPLPVHLMTHQMSILL